MRKIGMFHKVIIYVHVLFLSTYVWVPVCASMLTKDYTQIELTSIWTYGRDIILIKNIPIILSIFDIFFIVFKLQNSKNFEKESLGLGIHLKFHLFQIISVLQEYWEYEYISDWESS